MTTTRKKLEDTHEEIKKLIEESKNVDFDYWDGIQYEIELLQMKAEVYIEELTNLISKFSMN